MIGGAILSMVDVAEGQRIAREEEASLEHAASDIQVQ